MQLQLSKTYLTDSFRDGPSNISLKLTCNTGALPADKLEFELKLKPVGYEEQPIAKIIKMIEMKISFIDAILKKIIFINDSFHIDK